MRRRSSSSSRDTGPPPSVALPRFGLSTFDGVGSCEAEGQHTGGMGIPDGTYDPVLNLTVEHAKRWLDSVADRPIPPSVDAHAVAEGLYA
jgi:hypothetical protein